MGPEQGALDRQRRAKDDSMNRNDKTHRLHRETADADSDMPDEIDFSPGARGKQGLTLVLDSMRFRRALQRISDMRVDEQPLEAARSMQDEARKALAGTHDTGPR